MEIVAAVEAAVASSATRPLTSLRTIRGSWSMWAVVGTTMEGRAPTPRSLWITRDQHRQSSMEIQEDCKSHISSTTYESISCTEHLSWIFLFFLVTSSFLLFKVDVVPAGETPGGAPAPAAPTTAARMEGGATLAGPGRMAG